MKKTTLLYVLALMAVLTACISQKSGTPPTVAITGKWRLTETLADPGDGSGEWTPITTDSLTYTEFYSDGRVAGNALAGTTHYAITDSIHLALTISGNTAPVTYRYRVTPDSLLLNPPCREACGLRFVRIK